MPVSKFHFRLLKFIYKHPYIKGKTLKTLFMFFKHRRYNDGHFINALESLCRSGYIDCTVFKNAAEDTGQRIKPDEKLSIPQSSLELLEDGIFIPEKKSIYGEYHHYLVTDAGALIVEQEQTSRFRTWVPWGVTSIIAVASVLVGIANLYVSCNAK